MDELAKNKLQRPKKLATLANRWLPEIILRRLEWGRHEAEVEELRSLTRADVLAFVDSTIMSTSSTRQLRVHVKGAKEMERKAENAKNSGDTCPNTEGADGNIRVEADQVSQFRLSQALWPLPRHVW